MTMEPPIHSIPTDPKGYPSKASQHRAPRLPGQSREVGSHRFGGFESSLETFELGSSGNVSWKWVVPWKNWKMKQWNIMKLPHFCFKKTVQSIVFIWKKSTMCECDISTCPGFSMPKSERPSRLQGIAPRSDPSSQSQDVQRGPPSFVGRRE